MKPEIVHDATVCGEGCDVIGWGSRGGDDKHVLLITTRLQRRSHSRAVCKELGLCHTPSVGIVTIPSARWDGGRRLHSASQGD